MVRVSRGQHGGGHACLDETHTMAVLLQLQPVMRKELTCGTFSGPVATSRGSAAVSMTARMMLKSPEQGRRPSDRDGAGPR